MLRIAALALLTTLPVLSTAQGADTKAEEPVILPSQRPDGSWSARSIPVERHGVVPGTASDDVATTALVVLSLLGDGQSVEAGPFRERLVNALDWLVEVQAEDGAIVLEGSPNAMADHALATLALSEATVLSSTSRFRLAAKAAVVILEDSALAGGGWSASGKSADEVDLRATAWAAMAMASAGDAKLAERSEVIAAAAWRLRQAGMQREEVTTRDLSFELLTRQFAGESADTSPEFQGLASDLIAQPVEWKANGAGFDSESFYLRSLIAYQSGGQIWKDWQRTLKAVTKQWIDDEDKRFVVDATVPGGSVAAYGYATLSLEVYFRYARVIGAR